MDERRGRDAAAGSSADARASEGGGRRGLGTGFIGRRGAFHGHGYDLLAAEENEAERATVLSLLRRATAGLFGALGGGELAEFLAVSENEVHVAIEGHELADEHTAVLDGDAHAIVDVLEHLRSLRHRHGGGDPSKGGKRLGL